MIFYFRLIQQIKPTTVMLITILTPALATFWGVCFNHEPLHTHLLLGLLLLCAGLFLYAYRNAAQSNAK